MTTTLQQFRACLANDYARRSIGIDMTPEEAAAILARDDQLILWYSWWRDRPDGAVLLRRSSAHSAHREFSSSARIKSDRRPVPSGLIAVCISAAALAAFVGSALAVALLV